MKKHKYVADIFDLDAMDRLIDELDEYKKALPRKVEKFLNTLADRGITVANERTGVIDDLGNVKHYVSFTKSYTSGTGVYHMEIAGRDVMPYRSSWVTKKGIVTANVSPILMYEFGSGIKARNPLYVAGVGQGTFPGQKHAFNPKGWSWKGVDGKWHHSTGISPTMPMYNAWAEMKATIVQAANEVF